MGESGTGAYHGQTGFRTFSHARAVYEAGAINPAHRILKPPYGALIDRALKVILGRA